jgi:3-oxoacyl-[acyl-carrier-protein] synthase I
MSTDIAIESCGMVSSVGLHPSSACAAMRCRLNNFRETSFQLGPDANVLGASVPDITARGVQRLYLMAKDALDQVAEPLNAQERLNTPLLVCLAESTRVGRLADLDQSLSALLKQAGYGANPHSGFFSLGKVSVVAALRYTQKLLSEKKTERVLVVAVDSLLNQQTIQGLLAAKRLQGFSEQSGLIPGEGAGAMLLSSNETATTQRLTVVGIGQDTEAAQLSNDLPIRGQGLKKSVEHALSQAQIQSSQMGLRVADLSGESFYFEDAAMAMTRLSIHIPMPATLWLPAESLGDTGAASGAIALAWLHEAALRGYTGSRYALCHFSNDDGHRAALIAQLQLSASPKSLPPTP